MIAMMAFFLGCVGEKDESIQYSVHPASLDFGLLEYQLDPELTQIVSIYNEEYTNILVSPSGFEGAGVDVLSTDLDNYTEIKSGESQDIEVSVTETLGSWVSGAYTGELKLEVIAYPNGTPDSEVVETAAIPITWSLACDADGDGHDAADCGGPDCDDTDANLSPDATEQCDGRDNNCDGVEDEDSAADAATWYLDADSDGYGDASQSRVACTQPDSYVLADSDCDDGNDQAYPGATERCNEVDDDCDDAVDEDSAADAEIWYTDADADGYGDPLSTVLACTQPAGTANNDLDCDDHAAEVSPSAVEVCDSVDNDCDDRIDESVCD